MVRPLAVSVQCTFQCHLEIPQCAFNFVMVADPLEHGEHLFIVPIPVQLVSS